MTSFQGTWQIVQAGMDNAAITRTRTHSKLWKGREEEYIAPVLRESSGNHAADDTTTDDHCVGLFHGLRFVRHRAVIVVIFEKFSDSRTGC
jgi:hypothetical protein